MSRDQKAFNKGKNSVIVLVSWRVYKRRPYAGHLQKGLIMITGHGGNIQETAARLGCKVHDLVDMSSNLNPLGPIQGLEEYLCKNIGSIITLPDADANRVSKALAGLYDLDPDNIIAGNGTTQFIYSLPLALKFKKAIILAPVYADYGDACAMHGATTDLFMAQTAGKTFAWDFERLEKEIKDYDAVYVCNPNSPTGSLTPAEQIIGLASRNPKKWIVVDETYLPFERDWKNKSVAFSDLPNLMVFHSMSKIHRLPGLRIGFMKADRDVITKFMDFFLPWSINSLAQAAVFHLAERKKEVEDFIEESSLYAEHEKKVIKEGLKGTGIEFHESGSVFMLGTTDETLPDSERFHDMMLEKRIMIRNCSNFRGLTKRHFRISLHSRDNNLRFINAAKECLGPS